MTNQVTQSYEHFTLEITGYGVDVFDRRRDRYVLTKVTMGAAIRFMDGPLPHRDENGISDLSIAIDEIYALRALCATLVWELNRWSGYRLPKGVRSALEGARLTLAGAAAGGVHEVIKRIDNWNAQEALQKIGAKPTLTNHNWLTERSLIKQEGKE